MHHRKKLISLLLGVLMLGAIVLDSSAQMGSAGLSIIPDQGAAGAKVTVSFNIAEYVRSHGTDAVVADKYTLVWDLGGYPRTVSAGLDEVRDKASWHIIGSAVYDSSSGYLVGTPYLPLTAAIGEHWIYAIPDTNLDQAFYYWWGWYTVSAGYSPPSTTGGGCFIATATFGSELSPEVQFLRNFRETAVMSSFTGRQFVAWFNTAYYSFSPTVASSIASSEATRDWMKGSLYPMMGILHLGADAYFLLSFSPDLGIIVFVLLVSFLMSLVYLTPTVLIAMTPILVLKKPSISTKTVKVTGVVWFGCILAIVIAAVAQIPLMMMASGFALVGSTVFLTILGTAKLLLEHWFSKDTR